MASVKKLNNLEEIAKLEAQLDECNRLMATGRERLSKILKEQTLICAGRFKPVLANRARYTMDGLQEQLKEVCPNVYIKKDTYRCFYDREEQHSIKCKKCGMFIPLDWK